MSNFSLKRKVANGILMRLLGIRKNKPSEIKENLKWWPSDAWSFIAECDFSSCDNTGTAMEKASKVSNSILTKNIGVGQRILGAEYKIGKRGSKGYSRNPLESVNISQICDIELAIVSYLVRGYCHYFNLNSKRDFDSAKFSLNDIHQANQLTWRLYSTLPSSHLLHIDGDANNFFKHVLSSSLTRSNPNSKKPSAYFVWSALLLCEIIRGDIFRHIGYLQQSDGYYRHSEDQIMRLHAYAQKNGINKGLYDPSYAKYFITRPLISALNERAKVRLDLGQFLESLITQISCLHSLIWLQISEEAKSHKTALKIIDKIDKIISYLDAERVLPIFNRGLLHCHFGNPSYFDDFSINNNSILKNDDIKSIYKYIPEDLQGFCIDIIARIGFTLFTLRPKHWGLTGIDKDWINSYFRVDKLWNKTYKCSTQKSPLGQYCEAFFGFKHADDKVFGNDIDKRFAAILRSSIPGSTLATDWKAKRQQQDKNIVSPDARFYNDILQRTTENIGNILTIPLRNKNILMRRGYRYRVTEGDVGKKRRSKQKDVCKLVVLRRWQSYNPRIPKRGTKPLPGGGYLLFWRGKGIAIDPGYDFIQNLYDQGFSLDDIDAVIVTHSHPDHDDDLSTLTTLIKEWNEYHYEIGAKERIKRLDILLNESCDRKFSAWLQASKVKIGRVITLPVVCWNKDTKHAGDGPFRGENAIIDLRSKGKVKSDYINYNLRLEVVPAWHDDVIGKISAVGLKFHLYGDRRNQKIGVIGYTGDTGAYGLDLKRERERSNALRIDTIYKDCDAIIAHLGDVRMRELSSVMQSTGQPLKNKDGFSPVVSLTRSWMKELSNRSFKGKAQKSTFIKNRLHKLFDLLNALKILPTSALKAEIIISESDSKLRVQEWLGLYFTMEKEEVGPTEFDLSPEIGIPEILFDQFLKSRSELNNEIAQELRDQIRAAHEQANLMGLEGIDKNAYILIEYLVACGQYPWRYPYHLGLFGLFRIYEAIAQYRLNKKIKTHCAFIIGELPEELFSYRHRIAYLLDRSFKEFRGKKQQLPITSFTGDIGLHIGLKTSKGRLIPSVRCTYCNYNNETVTLGDNYHYPQNMVETQVSRYGGAMLYLCDQHYPGRFKTSEMSTLPEFFLNRPNIRVV